VEKKRGRPRKVTVEDGEKFEGLKEELRKAVEQNCTLRQEVNLLKRDLRFFEDDVLRQKSLAAAYKEALEIVVGRKENKHGIVP